MINHFVGRMKNEQGILNLLAGGISSLFGGGAKKPGKIDKEAGKIAGAEQAVKTADVRGTEEAQRGATAQQAVGGLITDLQAQAKGQGPSLAGAQLQSAQDRGLAQQLAAAQTQRAGGASTQRNLLRSQAEQNQQLAQQAAQARMQEQQSAQQQLGQVSGQERALASQLALQYQQQGFNQAQAQQQALLDLERLKVQQETGLAGERTAASGLGAAAGGGLLSGIGNLLGAGDLFSDKELKQDIKKIDKESGKFLDALQSYSYNYKDPSGPGKAEGTRYGIMAQDLEKSEMGKSLVKDTIHGKSVDTIQGFGAVLAAQSSMHKRIKQLESNLKKKKS